MMIISNMKSNRGQILALVLAGLVSQPAHADMIPGRWEKVSDLELGTPITVELKNGDRVEGEFEGLWRIPSWSERSGPGTHRTPGPSGVIVAQRRDQRGRWKRWRGSESRYTQLSAPAAHSRKPSSPE